MTQVLCPVIVGREAEVEALEHALVEAHAGRGGVVVVSGEAGIGKSRLARDVMDRARGRGMVVAAGRATEGTSQLPFRPLAEALQTAVREHGVPGDPALVPFRAALAPLVPTWAGGELASFEPSVVRLEGVLRLLRAFAQKRGLLVVLEDLQWADSDTVSAIEYLADHLASEPILCVCTERPGTSGGAAEVLGALVGRRAARRLHLGPLTEEAVEEMARISLDVDSAPPAVIGALRRRAEGVPFLVEEMLSAYVTAGGTPAASAEWWIALRVAEALPPSLHDLVRDRLASLDDATRDVVRAAAVLGRTFDWSLLPPMTGRDRDVALGSLRAAVAAQVLVGAASFDTDAFSFRHALVREAVLAQMLPPERAALSVAAAKAIEASRPGLPGEWCERAAELREQAGDRLGAVRLLQESARRALARGALATAEASLRRARELGEGDYASWVGTDELLVEVLARAGKAKEVVELSRRFVGSLTNADHPDAPSWVRWMTFSRRRQALFHLRAARAGLLAGEPFVADEHVRRAGDLAADDEDTVAQVRSLAAAIALASGDVDAAIAEATSALDDAERLDLGEVVCEALETIGGAESTLGDLRRAAATFQRLAGTAGTRSVWRVRALEELGAILSVTRGDPGLLEEARALALQTGAVSALASIELELGRHLLAQARREEAGVVVERALEAARRLGLPLLPEILVARAAVTALGDRKAETERALDEALEAGAGRADIEAAALGDVRAVLALFREERPAAIADLDAAAAIPARWRRGPPWFLGARQLLRTLEGQDDELPAPHRHPVLEAYGSLSVAVALGRAGEPQAAEEAFARGDAAMPPGWRHHHARRLVAEAAIADGWGEPATWLHDALAFFEETRFPRLANACKRLMRTAGVAVPRAGRGTSPVPPSLAVLGVTSREMDVLALVADGLSNAEIAERLFLSPRTVETHVKSLMRKSATHTRPQLVAFGGRYGARESERARV